MIGPFGWAYDALCKTAPFDGCDVNLPHETEPPEPERTPFSINDASSGTPAGIFAGAASESVPPPFSERWWEMPPALRKPSRSVAVEITTGEIGVLWPQLQSA